MAKISSKKSDKSGENATSSKSTKNSKNAKSSKNIKNSKKLKLSKDTDSSKLIKEVKPKKSSLQTLRGHIKTFRAGHLHLHKSFHRSYREDYTRETNTPGLLSHAMITFKTIFKYWRTFLPFIALMVFLYIFFVGLMNEEFYQQFQTEIDQTSEEVSGGKLGNFAKSGIILISTVMTGGLNAGMDDTQVTFTIGLFLIMWLVTIFLLRHFLAGEKPKLRDGLYNALGPLLSTMLVFFIIFIQAIPIMLVIITYSAAVATNFLDTPFYALVYFLFAATMVLLSGYLISSSIMGLVAVTAPGMYPLTALFAASDIMQGRRMKFVLRLIYLVLVVVLVYIIVMLPIILLDLWLKSFLTAIANWPIVPFFLLVVTCFIFIYLTTYIYLYYRWLLNYQEK